MKSKLHLVLLIIISIIPYSLKGSTTLDFADSIRKVYQIPELAYAVLSSNQVFEW